MKIAIAMVFAVLTPMAALGVTAEDKYQACLDTGFDMTGCTSTENERFAPILKAAYQAALARAKRDREQLAAVQKAWENSSFLTCDYEHSLGQGGTIGSLFAGGCLVDQTRRRIFELSDRGEEKLSIQNPSTCSAVPTNPDALANCIAEAFEVADKQLNSTYRKILATATMDDKTIGDKNIEESSANERSRLIAAEKAWIAFRDTQCGYLAARQQGTEARFADLRCRAAMTVQRTKELKQ